jgi:indole-3-glycerol phosphate synthase
VSARSGNVLERILAETSLEVERRKREQPLAVALREPRGRGGGGRFAQALAAPGIGVIAEFKRRSPAAGVLLEQADLREIVSAYARGGAVALSVLTEGPNFGGSLEDLRLAAEACELPRLRKDFIIDPYQLDESLAAGAEAVLLIVAALEQSLLVSLHAQARALGLDVLVEVHDGAELARALEAGAEIIGVNNRDLRDFSVDVARTERLMSQVPAGVTVVSESGIGAAEQLERLQGLGVQAVLVGESLMRSPDPQAALRRLRTFRGTESAL